MAAQSLMDPEPHYTPGYTGYLEGNRFVVGGTIAQRSHTALGLRTGKSPEMIHSRHPTAGSRPTTSMDTRGAIMPGYTGFYPKHQHENEGIGERFSIRATNAWKTQDQHVKRRRNRMENIRAKEIRQLQSKLENDRSNERQDGIIRHPMLKPQQLEDETWKPKPIEKPYFMDSGNKLRFFKSGYTGYLPRSRDFFAQGLTQTSNLALQRMDAEHSDGKYYPVPRQPLKPNENKSIDTRISVGQGMKPGYTGYIPGSRFIFAKTYGRISYDAFNK